MLLKVGVDISRLERPIRRALTAVAKTLKKCNVELVITSTYEGNHSPGSLHYANLAFDLRRTGLNDTDVRMIRRELDDDYDVVDERTHIHIEYDPK